MSLHLKDIFRLTRKLTIRKAFNLIKLIFSFYISKWSKKPNHWGMPLTVSIEPTTACNLKCPECPSGLRSFTRRTGNLKTDFFRSTIDQLSRDLLYLIFYFQGEPYINPAFLDMVAYAEKKGIYTITSTNGHFLDDENCRRTIESGLSRMIISVDGTTQEVYEQYRKEGSLEKVLEGAKNMVKWKKELNSHTPHLIFQFLVVKPNEHQIPEIYELAEQIGIDEVKLKTAQLYDYKQGNPLMPVDDRYSRYKLQENGQFEIKNELLDQCWKLWHDCVITWNGQVVPCCFDKDAKHVLGDLKEKSFVDIWRGHSYQTFRTKVLKGRKEIDICQNCTEGCRVWV